MDKLIITLLVLQHTAADKLKGRREAGQGTIEYIAMMALALVVIVALITVFTTAGTSLAAKVTGIVSKITSIGGA